MLTTVLMLSLVASNSFDDAKSKAQEVESLKKTVAALLGDCAGADFDQAASCEENLSKQARRLRKGSYSVWLPPSDESLIRYKGPKGKKHRLLVTPVFDAGDGHALTVGRPRRLDKKSRTPFMKFMVVDGELAPGVLASDLKRALRLGNVSMELVGVFGKTWSLKHKKGKVEGVAFKPTHIRFANARNGKTILDARVR